MYKDTAESKLFLLEEQQKQLKKEIRYLKRKLKDTQVKRRQLEGRGKVLQFAMSFRPGQPRPFWWRQSQGA